jgi:hypothetical protein
VLWLARISMEPVAELSGEGVRGVGHDGVKRTNWGDMRSTRADLGFGCGTANSGHMGLMV